MKKFLISTLAMLVMGLGVNAQTTLLQETKNEFKKWGFVDEIGYGFLGDNAWAFKATIGFDYSFTNKFYTQGQIGYNSSNSNKLFKSGKYSYSTHKINAHFITLPFEVGYRVTTENRLWGFIPFAGLGLNIGLGGKYKYDDNIEKDLKIGGKLGVEARVGLRICLHGFQLTGSYHLPMNSKQEDFFGEDAYPELSIGFYFIED